MQFTKLAIVSAFSDSGVVQCICLYNRYIFLSFVVSGWQWNISFIYEELRKIDQILMFIFSVSASNSAQGDLSLYVLGFIFTLHSMHIAHYRVSNLVFTRCYYWESSFAGFLRITVFISRKKSKTIYIWIGYNTRTRWLFFFPRFANLLACSHIFDHVIHVAIVVLLQ